MSDSEYPSAPQRHAKGKKGKRAGNGQSSQMEFMKGVHNFRVNDVSVRHTEGDYHDHSVKNTHNDFSSHVRNEYDQSNSRAPIFNGNIHGPVNNYNHGIVISKPRKGEKGEFDAPGYAQQGQEQKSFRCMVAQETANSLARRCILSLLRTVNLTVRQQIRGLIRGMAIPAKGTQPLILTSLAQDITQIQDTSINSSLLHMAMATSPTNFMGTRT
ncbi:hypothetical protein H1R20_g6749, partial [Candolleomyces eurysporus]